MSGGRRPAITGSGWSACTASSSRGATAGSWWNRRRWTWRPGGRRRGGPAAARTPPRGVWSSPRAWRSPSTGAGLPRRRAGRPALSPPRSSGPGSGPTPAGCPSSSGPPSTSTRARWSRRWRRRARRPATSATTSVTCPPSPPCAAWPPEVGSHRGRGRGRRGERRPRWPPRPMWWSPGRPGPSRRWPGWPEAAGSGRLTACARSCPASIRIGARSDAVGQPGGVELGLEPVGRVAGEDQFVGAVPATVGPRARRPCRGPRPAPRRCRRRRTG